MFRKPLQWNVTASEGGKAKGGTLPRRRQTGRGLEARVLHRSVFLTVHYIRAMNGWLGGWHPIQARVNKANCALHRNMYIHN